MLALAVVEVPRAVISDVAAGGVVLEYRDVYGTSASASDVVLVWSRDQVSTAAMMQLPVRLRLK